MKKLLRKHRNHGSFTTCHMVTIPESLFSEEQIITRQKTDAKDRILCTLKQDKKNCD